MSKFIVNLRNYERPYYYNGRKTKYSVTFDGRVFNKKTNKEVAYAENSNGYLTFGTSDVKNGLKGPKMVHRFVAETFIPNPENKRTVNHKDNNRKNNRADNLEWMSQSENIRYALKQNRLYIAKGEENKNCKYSDEKIRQVCELLQAGYRNKDIADMTGVQKHYISSIRNREWRKDISRDYVWDTIAFKDRHGENAANASITEKQAREICKLIKQGKGNKEIADIVGCKWYNVRNIRNGSAWKYISDQFDI